MSYAHLELFLIEQSDELYIRKRPMVIICPGGGYVRTTDREAIAYQFLSMGYHCAVLKYSCKPAEFPTALLELARSVQEVRMHAQEWGVLHDGILVSGSSAGGHLAACLGLFWKEPWLANTLALEPEAIRPNGLILGYPVIASGEFAHTDSFRNLLGDRYQELKDSLSLERQVNQHMPKTFLWHTLEDQLVPIQNSVLLVNEMIKQGLSIEFHLFQKGKHGLGLANILTQKPDGSLVEPAASEWINLVHHWIDANYPFLPRPSPIATSRSEESVSLFFHKTGGI
jgi:acetyl esterase/lipase